MKFYFDISVIKMYISESSFKYDIVDRRLRVCNNSNVQSTMSKANPVALKLMRERTLDFFRAYSDTIRNAPTKTITILTFVFCLPKQRVLLRLHLKSSGAAADRQTAAIQNLIHISIESPKQTQINFSFVPWSPTPTSITLPMWCS